MEAVRDTQGVESAAGLARELEGKRGKLYDCCAAFERYGEEAFPAPAAAPRMKMK